MHEMAQISKEGYKKCEVKIIDKRRYFWVNRKYLEVESGVANWAHIFDKLIQKNKNTGKNQHLMQNINDVGCLYEMI